MHIVGTAGHVDHGKSSLVMALTGTNPDRWLEERLRGMTLDLGFAHLRFEDGVEAGIVDVPGHERFLHNMLAGAAGMELLLLVVAADEGVMPQTTEHLQILQYLNVRQTIVVVSKSDLLPREELSAAIEEIAKSLQATIAQDAPMVAVSTITGNGMDELRARIRSALDALPERDASAPAYLPIDRVFTLPGHGTIVTGTLIQGRIEAGDRLKLEPSGKISRARSLQTFGRKREYVEAGARVAINLPGIETSEIARGEVVAAPMFSASDRFSVLFRPLAQNSKLLRTRNAVRAYIGAGEILGTLVLPDIPAHEQPIEGTLFLRSATIAYRGAPFVVRRLSPKDLLGGGTLEAPRAAQASFASGDRDPHAQTVVSALRAATPNPQTAAEVARAANMTEEAAETTLGELMERGEIVRVERPAAFLERAAAETILSRALSVLRERHRIEPWAIGATSLAIARRLELAEPLLVRILAAAAQDGRLAHRAGYYAATDHKAELSTEQTAFFETLIPEVGERPFAPVALEPVLGALKESRVPGIGGAFDTLLAHGALVKVNAELYRGTQIVRMRARIESFLRANGRMTPAEFRDLIGTSRKYAVPLLEWFDARGITVRSGDYRMLRSRQR